MRQFRTTEVLSTVTPFRVFPELVHGCMQICNTKNMICMHGLLTEHLSYWQPSGIAVASSCRSRGWVAVASGRFAAHVRLRWPPERGGPGPAPYDSMLGPQSCPAWQLLICNSRTSRCDEKVVSHVPCNATCYGSVSFEDARALTIDDSQARCSSNRP